MSQAPRVEQRDGALWVTLPNEEPFRVLSWRAPRLVLERGNVIKSFLIAPSADGESVWVSHEGRTRQHERPGRSRASGVAAAVAGHEDLSSPMPGKILQVLVAEGQQVEAGQRLVVVEAMKMENALRAPHDSTVTKIHFAEGDTVAAGDCIVELDATE